MKVLVGHEFYRSSAPSGEDAVYRAETRLLEDSGMDVVRYEVHNDDIDDSGPLARIRLGLEAAWSGRSYRRMAEVVRQEQPRIAHFHSTFPLMSPSVYAACRDNGVAVVQTLHNYRMTCPGAMLMRDGKVCEDCLGGSYLPAILHRCYRDSLLATGAVARMLRFNWKRGNYENLVDRYIVLTEFSAEIWRRVGIPARHIAIKPNFVADHGRIGAGEGGYLVFAGRLSREKGVETLLRAWRELPDVPLKVLGSGPLESEVRARVASEGLPIELLGYRENREVLRTLMEAEAMVLPSESYEGLPITLIEAYSVGTPVVASDIGSLSELVNERVTGIKFQPGDPTALAAAVRAGWKDGASSFAGMRKAARATYDEQYSPKVNLAMLEEIYTSVLSLEDERARHDHSL